MSSVKCEICGCVITHCPNCNHRVVSNEQQTENMDSPCPTIPAFEVDLTVSGLLEDDSSMAEWNLNTALPAQEKETASPVLEDFFSSTPVVPIPRKVASDINPNPEINRETLTPRSYTSPVTSSPYSNYRVKETTGNYNIEELTKIAVEQQFREERRRKRRVKMIRRCVVMAIIFGLLIYNWDWVMYFTKMFMGGWSAAMEIFSMLGGLSITPQ